MFSVYCDAAGTIFGTTDVYELSFSHLSIRIFITFLQRHFSQNVSNLVSLVQQRLLLFMKEQKEKKNPAWTIFSHHQIVFRRLRFWSSLYSSYTSSVVFKCKTVRFKSRTAAVLDTHRTISVPRILESLLLDGHHYSICIIIPFNSIIIALITEILLFLLNLYLLRHQT